MNKKYIHYFLFVVEMTLVVAVFSSDWFLDYLGPSQIVRHHPMGTLLTVSAAVALLSVSIGYLYRLFADKGCESNVWRCKWACFLGVMSCVGLFLACIGGVLIPREFVDKMWNEEDLSVDRRFDNFDGVVVSFDSGPGMENVRVARLGRSYADNMNVYPSENVHRYKNLSGIKLDQIGGWLYAECQNRRQEDCCVNYFSFPALPERACQGRWTYVVEVDSFEGDIAGWFVGQTLPTNANVWAQLKIGRIPFPVRSGEVRFVELTANNFGSDYNLLDRAYIYAKSGQSFKAKFRVSLFAGTGVNESNYRYVRPGETLACPLPVPTREGYAFEGWYDGDRRITEESKVEKREAHTLKARWRKL